MIALHKLKHICAKYSEEEDIGMATTVYQRH